MKKLLLALATASAPLAVFATKTAVTTCGAEALECYAVVNAIGDPVEIDVSQLQVTKLGSITAERKVDITLPAKVETSTAYSLSPSTGDFKVKTVNIVFENIKQRPGTRLFGKTKIGVYRRPADAPKAEPWIEIGHIVVETKELTPEEAKTQVTFKADGTAVWTDPKTKAKKVFLTGTKDLSKAAAQERAEEAQKAAAS